LNFGDIFGVMALTFNNLPALITGFGLKIPFAGPICTVGGAEAPDAVAWAITVVPSEPRGENDRCREDGSGELVQHGRKTLSKSWPLTTGMK
jgi:hypothetical protein